MKIGDVVNFERYDENGDVVSSQPAFVAGIVTAPGYATGEDPAVNLVIFDEANKADLGTPEWSRAFKLVNAVKHATHEHIEGGQERQGYVNPDAAAQLKQIGEFLTANFQEQLSARIVRGGQIATVADSAIDLLRDLLGEPPATKPSAADLDHVAEEAEAANQTAAASEGS